MTKPFGNSVFVFVFIIYVHFTLFVNFTLQHIYTALRAFHQAVNKSHQDKQVSDGRTWQTNAMTQPGVGKKTKILHATVTDNISVV